MTVSPSLVGAHCAAHPALAAVEICTRCGAFLCGECVTYVKDELPSCAACVPHVTGGRATTRARLAPALTGGALVGMVAGFLFPGRVGLSLWALSLPTGFVGLTLAVQELRLIRAGVSAPAGRRWARLGVAFGLLFALVAGLLLVGFALFVARLKGLGGPG